MLSPAARRRLALNPAARALYKARVLVNERDIARQRPRDSLRFLLTSPEVSNFTYELENRGELAELLAGLLDHPAAELTAHMDELEADDELRGFLAERLRTRSERRDTPLYGKRYALYALVRALRPEVVAETGTHDGFGTMVMARALERNGAGRVLTFDINPEAGWMIGGPLAARITPFVGDAEHILGDALEEHGVDLFFHDSTPSLERAEHQTALRCARGKQLVLLTDDVKDVSPLPVLARERGARYGVFQERPTDHFWRGNKLAVAVFSL